MSLQIPRALVVGVGVSVPVSEAVTVGVGEGLGKLNAREKWYTQEGFCPVAVNSFGPMVYVTIVTRCILQKAESPLEYVHTQEAPESTQFGVRPQLKKGAAWVTPVP